MKHNLPIIPLSNKVILLPDPPPEKTLSGISLPISIQLYASKNATGTVIAIGPGKVDTPMQLQPGDKVIYGKHTGTEVQIDNTDYLVISEDDIFSIVEID